MYYQIYTNTEIKGIFEGKARRKQNVIYFNGFMAVVEKKFEMACVIETNHSNRLVGENVAEA